MNFATAIKSYRNVLVRFMSYWNNAKVIRPFKIGEFASLDFNSQLGHWLAYLETENIGVEVGKIGYDLYVITDNQEQYPDIMLHSEENGYKYLKREVFHSGEENGIIVNYQRAILEACSLLNELYATGKP